MMFPNYQLPLWLWIFWTGIVFAAQYGTLLLAGILAVYLWRAILTKFSSIPKRIHSAIQGVHN